MNSAANNARNCPQPSLNGTQQTILLDQGYWPDGLYTPPCEEAMIFDILSIKKLMHEIAPSLH